MREEYIYSLCVLIVMAVFLIVGLKNDKKDVNNGILLILGFTLIALIFYASDTRRMANYQSKMYFSPRLIPWIQGQVVEDSTVSVKLIYHNLTQFYINANTTLTITCFKDTLDIPYEAYTGDKVRTIPPMSTRTGGFPINNKMLKKSHRTVQQLKQSKNKEALKINVALELSNKYDGKASLETIYNFNFALDAWEEYNEP